MQFFALGSSKIEVLGSSKVEVSKTNLFEIVTTHNDHPSYVKHVLGSVYVFFTLFGYWVWACVCGGGGSPKGLVHNLLMHFFTLGSSKSKFSKVTFFDIIITHNVHPS